MMPTRYIQPVLETWAARRERTLCTVDGECMAPIINEGDAVVIEHGNRDIRPGDVIVCGAPGRYRVQRVIRIARRRGGRVVLAKGDQSARCLPPIRHEQILGKVVEVRGSSGRLQLDTSVSRALNRVLACWSRFSERRRRAAGVVHHVVRCLAALPWLSAARGCDGRKGPWRLVRRLYGASGGGHALSAMHPRRTA